MQVTNYYTSHYTNDTSCTVQTTTYSPKPQTHIHTYILNDLGRRGDKEILTNMGGN